MAHFLDLIAFRWVQRRVLARLCPALATYGADPEALWITASALGLVLPNCPETVADWHLLVTPQRWALLIEQPVIEQPVIEQQPASPPAPDQVLLGLSFDPTAIAAFLTWLVADIELGLAPDPERDRAPTRPPLAPLLDQLRQAHQWLSLQPPTPESWILDLLDLLSETMAEMPASQPQPQPQPHPELDRHIGQQQQLDRVIAKIRRSLGLSEILQTTVDEVRQFLQVDRLAVYQFQDRLNIPDGDNGGHQSAAAIANLRAKVSTPPTHWPGVIAYEARVTQSLPSMLHYGEKGCLGHQSGQGAALNGLTRSDTFPPLESHAHSSGSHPSGSHSSGPHPFALNTQVPKAITDIQQAYQDFPCLLNVLTQAQVRSKLVAPIWVGDRLWGLLIAHQCTYQRQWQTWEIDFLQHMGEHLAVAIAQTELHRQLQQQKRSLEAYVIERTQALRDTMVAAQSASRAKSEFLATMSHELRTPLTCIIGMSATLLRWSFGDLSPRQQDYLTTIHDSGDRLLNLINDILEVSKIESGRTVLEVNEFSLSSLSRQCLDSFQDKAYHQGIETLLDIRLSAQQDQFTADPRRIKQILQNLLSNAIKFTPAGGKVTLRLWREKQIAVLRVEDTGIGIPEAQQPLLFEKFQQLETTRHRQYQGTGLGLALTKQLIELHGGSIAVESKVNYGSAFTVRLPMQSITPQNSPPPQLETVTPEPILGRIVLVEDHEETAGIICDMLTAADYQVIWVIDGSQVVDQVELLQPMAVIIDMALPGTDGQEIINALRQGMATSNVKILTLQNPPEASEEEPPRQSADLGKTDSSSFAADDAILKPIDPAALLVKINGLMTLSH